MLRTPIWIRFRKLLVTASVCDRTVPELSVKFCAEWVPILPVVDVSDFLEIGREEMITKSELVS